MRRQATSAHSHLSRELDEIVKSGDINQQADLAKATIQAFHSFFANAGLAAEGIEPIADTLNKLESAAAQHDLLAFTANKAGMLAWIINDYDRCIRYTKMALHYSPLDASYHYNLCLAYDKMGLSSLLSQTLEQLSKLPDLDNDHLTILQKHGISPQESSATEGAAASD